MYYTTLYTICTALYMRILFTIIEDDTDPARYTWIDFRAAVLLLQLIACNGYAVVYIAAQASLLLRNIPILL